MRKATRMLVLAAFLAACEAAGPMPVPTDRLAVQIETVETLQLESYPVQRMLHVTGWLPNPCTTPQWEVEARDQTVVVELYALSDGSEACVAMLAPFDVNIPLGPMPEGGVRIELNGEVVAE